VQGIEHFDKTGLKTTATKEKNPLPDRNSRLWIHGVDFILPCLLYSQTQTEMLKFICVFLFSQVL
jgi:hypothetical protein